MILTFTLFVGPPVVVVGVYVAFAMQGQAQELARSTLLRYAERIADRLEETDSTDTQRAMISEVSALADLRIDIMPAQAALRHADVSTQVRILPEESPSRADPVRFVERSDADGRIVLYALLFHEPTGLIVSVGQPESPLVSMFRNMRTTLVVSMALILLLALAGSWVATNKITTPLQALNNSARRIAEGNPGENIEVDSRAAEFRVLAMSLNRMSAGFQRQINELQTLTQLQNEFIGNVGHEVRNPTFAVSGYLEALGSDSLTPEKRRRYAEKGLANLHRLQTLFSDLIEIARLEYREDLINPAPFELSELLREIGDTLDSKVKEKELHLELENPIEYVYADRNRIRQVLTNLIENAISYTDEGTVRCRFRRRLDKVRIEIIDTGRGIEEHHLDRVFERFYRVDPDRARQSGGSGLGLSIVHQILRAHNEPVYVESTFGRGSRFWFELPLANPA
ncbi:MAG: HAMP domain-containing histidine kinase [Bacteroidetes bacterium SB0662_bin_6]|nr:HAMP domain-containing histidine kinase [Bacteroidetes bacterium SB0668_bin_1]MYE04812.1 HAMP domain-containing histidine kinase [Bacteroidetes bacterium SB0662_bin_6]